MLGGEGGCQNLGTVFLSFFGRSFKKGDRRRFLLYFLHLCLFLLPLLNLCFGSRFCLGVCVLCGWSRSGLRGIHGLGRLGSIGSASLRQLVHTMCEEALISIFTLALLSPVLAHLVLQALDHRLRALSRGLF